MTSETPNVTVALVKGDEDCATRDMFIKHVPTLRALTDEAMAAALADLYHCGAEAGAEKANEVLQELGGWIGKLVAAHQRKDALEVFATLEAFIAARCVIIGGPSPTPAH